MDFSDALDALYEGKQVYRRASRAMRGTGGEYLYLYRHPDPFFGDQLLVVWPGQACFPAPASSRLLLGDDWEVMTAPEPPPGTVTREILASGFAAALRALRRGEKIRRRFWEDPLQNQMGRYIYLHHYESPLLAPQVLAVMEDETRYPFSGSQVDLLADDWEILGEVG